MKKFISLLCLIIFLAQTSLAIADEFPTLPTWVYCKSGAEQYACFSLEEMKSLLSLETQARTLYKENQSLKDLIKGYDKLVQSKDLEIDILNQTIQVLQKSYDDQSKQLENEIAEKNKYKYEPRFNPGNSTVAWLVAGGILLFSGGAITGIYLFK